MRIIKLAVVVLTVAFATPVIAAEKLYRMEVNQKNPGGKDLVMKFEELRRDEKTSEIKVEFVSGASVPSSMFIARGCYEIARARDAAYFILLKEWRGENKESLYLVGFCNGTSVNPQEYFGLKEPLKKDGDKKFLSVKDFKMLFDPAK